MFIQNIRKCKITFRIIKWGCINAINECLKVCSKCVIKITICGLLLTVPVFQNVSVFNAIICKDSVSQG